MKIETGLLRFIAMGILIVAGFTACSSPKQIGKLSLLSERNIEPGDKYELKALGRSATAPTIQEAVAQLVTQAPDGLFLKNAEITCISKKKFQVTGDVWGKAPNEIPSSNVPKPTLSVAPAPAAYFKVGDDVQFMNASGRLKTGKIVALKPDRAVVQTRSRRNLVIQVEVPFQSLKIRTR